MSKYIKLEDAIRNINLEVTGRKEYTGDMKANLFFALDDLPTIEVSEENEFKFYYVESIDDYWIGKRLDNFYYAEWRGDWFVWTHSRHLPWGEHIVNEGTLWKEHTYPSEPREIPFTEWIVGFMKKYSPEVSEDCISRADLLKTIDDNVSQQYSDTYETYGLDLWALFIRIIKNAPSVVPSRAEGEWVKKQEKYQMAECSNCKKVTMHEMWGDKLVYYDYCPNCGAKMKG